MIYFYLQNQSYHVQMLGIVIREHRQLAFFLFVCCFCYYHEDKPQETSP